MRKGKQKLTSVIRNHNTSNFTRRQKARDEDCILTPTSFNYSSKSKLVVIHSGLQMDEVLPLLLGIQLFAPWSTDLIIWIWKGIQAYSGAACAQILSVIEHFIWGEIFFAGHTSFIQRYWFHQWFPKWISVSTLQPEKSLWQRKKIVDGLM